MPGGVEEPRRAHLGRVGQETQQVEADLRDLRGELGVSRQLVQSGCLLLGQLERLGAVSAIWIAKQTKITMSRATIKASSERKPRCMRKRIKNASAAVMIAPIVKGMPKSRLSAIAVPITSARSQAMIAASQASHSAMLTGFE